jgi:phosphoribosylformylglycinamidine synthase
MSLHPTYGRIDTYHMAAVSIDEAVRRLLAVGGRLEHMGGVDNFCWPNIQFDPEKNPDGKLKAAQLVRANWALKDYCLAYGIPLLSGKDSMYIDGHLPGEFGETHKVSGLPTLLFTATSVIPDISRSLTLDLKEPGDYIYIIGQTGDELGGSEYYELYNYTGLHVPEVDAEKFLKYYRQLEDAIENGLLASCHAICRGGLAVHLAMKAMAGELGLEVDLAAVAKTPKVALYSESAGRFLISVAPADCERLQAMMAGAPLLRLGQVRSDHLFAVHWDEKPLIKTDIMDLKTTFKKRFGDLL